MSFKLIGFLGLAAVLLQCTVLSMKYEYISDCAFYDRGLIFGNDNITFICGQRNNEAHVIIDSEKFNCSNSLFLITNLWVGTVNFRNCLFSQMRTKFFEEFINIHTFNFSDLELERLQPDALKEAKNLTYFTVSHNLLNEIPSLLFVHNKKILHADFTANTIKTVDPNAFVGAMSLISLDLSQNEISTLDKQVFKDLSNLKKLNLSHNRLTDLDASILPVSLLELDLSYNSLASLKEHNFDKLINLKRLDLSNNPVGNFNPDIFDYLTDLEHLFLREMELTHIDLGSFEHQHYLVSLDLSGNELEKIDFKLFSPVMRDLKTLRLADNKLNNLNGFRNTLFPQLTSLDIQNNAFSCNYLKYFMELINWEKLQLSFDRKSFDPREMNVRGIKCKQTSDPFNPIDNSINEKLSAGESCFNSQMGDVHTIKVLLVLVFMMILTYFVILVVYNRHQITRHFRDTLANYRPNTRQSTTTLNVEY